MAASCVFGAPAHTLSWLQHWVLPTKAQQHLQGLSARKTVPRVLLSSSSIPRGIRARSECVTATLAPLRTGRGGALLGDEPSNCSTSQSVTYRVPGSCPQGSILMRCHLHDPETGSCLGWCQQQDRLPAWLAPTCSLQHPRPCLEGQPIPPRGLLQRERHRQSQHPPPKGGGPPAPTHGAPAAPPGLTLPQQSVG